jgi:glycosyltransferase involved in cell wall biosynthesis
MIEVLIFIGKIQPSSIPFEMAKKTHERQDVNVTLVSFYDKNKSEVEASASEGLMNSVLLDGKSRFDPSAWRRLYKEMSKDKYDIIHTHQNFIGSVARVIAEFCDISIVDTEHRPHDSFTLLQNLVNAPTLRLADKVVSNSHSTQSSFRWYEELILSDHQKEVVYNGIDINRIDSRVQSAEPSNELAIITVGRFVRVKNISTIIQSFSLIKKEFPDATLVLVGYGPLREELEDLCKNLNISSDVRFTGKVSRNRVYEELAGAKVFALMSFAEGFCVSAVEAMAAGLPVVASDIDVLHEVIGDPGVFVNPGDPDEIAKALAELLENSEKRRRQGEEARERARTTFSIDRTVREYAKIYRELADS